MSQENLNIAINAALKAGKKILEIYQSDNFEIQVKSDNSPLTKADIASNQIIELFLKDTGIPILSEEGKDVPFENRQHWDTLWIVDPIDGTKEFIKRNGEFTVNIALVKNQVPILGVIYAPALNILYFSLESLGAFKIKIDTHEQVTVDQLLENCQRLPINKVNQTYTIVASRSHLSTETEDFIKTMKSKHGAINLISIGSSLKLCMVAEGLAHCYPRLAPTMEWDTAAGHAICKAAGFNVVNWNTKSEMTYNRKQLRNDWFLVN